MKEIEKYSSTKQRKLEVKNPRVESLILHDSFPDSIIMPEESRLLHIKFQGGQEKTIPVLDCRRESHHEMIASTAASGKPFTYFGVGLYGLSAIVESPSVNPQARGSRAFFEAKSGRKETDKVPVFGIPESLKQLMDIDLIHPEFRMVLDDPDYIWKLGNALHIIAPIRKDSRIDPVFVTTPEIAKEKGLPNQKVNTASFFWWDDPDGYKIARRISELSPEGIGGISSFNEHGEAPAWNLDGVIDFVSKKGIAPFDMVVTDSIAEPIGIRSSFDQVGIPTIYDDPVWKFYREGPLNKERFVGDLNKKYGTDFGYVIMPTAKVASRSNADEAYLDDALQTVQKTVWYQRNN